MPDRDLSLCRRFCDVEVIVRPGYVELVIPFRADWPRLPIGQALEYLDQFRPHDLPLREEADEERQAWVIRCARLDGALPALS